MYRSPNTPPGSFRKLNTSHLHIDGGKNIDALEVTMLELERMGFPGKIHKVLASLSGPQRAEHALSKTYEIHTPTIEGQEAFDHFSTTLLQKRSDVRKAIECITKNLGNKEGGASVIEVEHLVAEIDQNGEWHQVDNLDQEPLTKEELGYALEPTLPFEIHNIIDIPADENPLELGELLAALKDQGISLGGVFNFEKNGTHAYRTNAFAELEGITELVQKQYKFLDQYLKAKYQNPRLRTIVERVLGVWKPY